MLTYLILLQILNKAFQDVLVYPSHRIRLQLTFLWTCEKETTVFIVKMPMSEALYPNDSKGNRHCVNYVDVLLHGELSGDSELALWYSKTPTSIVPIGNLPENINRKFPFSLTGKRTSKAFVFGGFKAQLAPFFFSCPRWPVDMSDTSIVFKVQYQLWVRVMVLNFSENDGILAFCIRWRYL